MNFKHHHINQGEGIPLVFQHGLGSSIGQADCLLGNLKGIQLIGMDCPGHGLSPFPNNMLPSFDFYADEVLSLLDHLEIEQAIFGGISMGSGIAVNIALRFPERVKGLILVRPAWLEEGTPDNLKILLEAARYINQPDGQSKFEKLDSFQSVQKSLPNAALSILGVFGESQQKEIPKVLECMVKDRPFSQLKKIQTIQKPCVILANDNDPLHPFEMAEVIHQHIAGSTLHKVTSRYVDDARHGEEVRNLIKQFIQNL